MSNPSTSASVTRLTPSLNSLLQSATAQDGRGFGLEGVFDNFLAHLRDLATSTSATKTANTREPRATDKADTTSTTSSSSAARDVAEAWKDFISQWQNLKHKLRAAAHKHATAGSPNPNDENDESASADSKNVKATESPPPFPVSATDDPDPQPVDPAEVASEAGTESPTVKDLLIQLAALLQKTQKNLQDSAVSPPASTTNAKGDHLDLNQFLAELQKLIGTSHPRSTTAETSDQPPQVKTQPTFTLPPSGTTPADATPPTDKVAENTEPSAPLPSEGKAFLDALKTLKDARQKSDVTRNNEQPSSAPSTADTAARATTESPATLAQRDLVEQSIRTVDEGIKKLNALFGGALRAQASNDSVAPSATASVPVTNIFAALTETKNGNAPQGGWADGNANTNSFGNKATGNEPTPATAGVTADGIKGANAASFTSQLATARGANTLPTAVEQVMFHLNRSVKNGQDQMTLQLKPAELGLIQIKLTFAGDGSVQGSVIASSQATLDMLTKDSRNLERALQDAGLQADPGSLHFSLGDQTGDTSRQESAEQRTAATKNHPEAADAPAPDSSNPADLWILTPTRVNMKV